jgi:hypothetical protein
VTGGISSSDAIAHLVLRRRHPAAVCRLAWRAHLLIDAAAHRLLTRAPAAVGSPCARRTPHACTLPPPAGSAHAPPATRGHARRYRPQNGDREVTGAAG